MLMAPFNIILSALVLVLSTLPVWAQTVEPPAGNFAHYHGHGMMWGGGNWSGFGMVLGPIFMILVLIAVIVGVVYLLKLLGLASTPSVGSENSGNAISILKERFARGEIDAKEFEDRKRLLID